MGKKTVGKIRLFFAFCNSPLHPIFALDSLAERMNEALSEHAKLAK